MALDFDGVLSDTINSWVYEYNKLNAFNLDIDFITSRNVDKWGFFEDLNLSQHECFQIFGLAWQNWKELKPMEPHLKQKTKMLNNLIEVDVVTAVQPQYLKYIKKWLEWHKITYNELVHSNEKYNLDYDIYIDDASRNIEKVFNVGKIGLLMNQPWNRDVSNIHNGKIWQIKRVYNLYHAIDVVRGLI